MNFEEYENNRLMTLPKRIDWWLDARFGMFIHVGLYSVKADHEWCKGNQNIKTRKVIINLQMGLILLKTPLNHG